MSEFEAQINSAKKRYYWGTLVTGTLVVIVAACVLVFGVFSRAVVFQVKPDEIADSYEADVDQGFGLLIGDTFYALSDSYTLTFSRAEFFPKTVALTKRDPQLQVVNLAPKPAQVAIETLPAYAQTRWQVSGQPIVIGERYQNSLAPGSYQLEIDNPFYQKATMTLELARASEFEKRIELVPIEGRVSLASNPSGAQVSVNGEVIGNTPLTLDKQSGSYQVELRAKGFNTIKESVKVTRARPEPKRNYQLVPATMLVDFELNPQGGLLFVNGKQIEPSSSGYQARLAVNSQHQIRYSKAGFQNYASSYDLPLSAYDDQVEGLTYPITLSPLLGQLDISVNVDAEILINGQAKGKTQYKTKANQTLTLTLPSKATEVMIRAPGYRSQVRKLTPEANRTTPIHFNLQTEYLARRAEGKPTVAQTLGIQLMRFAPDRVTMGSLPNEPYRRRNEFRREVTFSKPILVSKHEITEGQFNRVTSGRSGSELPVVNVSWQQAALFCNELSKQEGLLPFYFVRAGQVIGMNQNSNGYRLPSEAEWEWLAGKAKKAKKTIYPWGDMTLPKKEGENLADETLKGQQVFYFKEYQDGSAGRAKVGSFKAGKSGLFDLGGNVSEWVHDAYTNRPPTAGEVVQDYMGPSRTTEGAGHVVKGASFKTGQNTAIRVAYREPLADKNDSTGFRIVRTLSTSGK